MITAKQINIFAFVICILLYLTCYFRFAGQAILSVIQMISAIFLSFEVFSKQGLIEIKKQIKTYWISTILNATILFCFFNAIMWNDFLQIVFVSVIPNITAIYFFRILIKYEKIQ